MESASISGPKKPAFPPPGASVKRMFLHTCAFIALAVPTHVFANPQGGNVTAGNATISENGSTLTIDQTSSRAVIDWRSFNIDPNETTRFNQPSSTSITLNRVNAPDPSYILGTLSANGNIILVNPSGVFFGAGSVVDVAGLVATTADITNENFMAGNYKFDIPGNPDARIVNEGLITAHDAGLVGLVAPQVENSGVIRAHLGRVSMASGDTFTLDMYGDNLINVAVSDDLAKQIVSNTGTIEAAGGTITMTAAAGRSVVNSLITVAGEIKAPVAQAKNGKIVIGAAGSNHTAKTGKSKVLVSGRIDASGKRHGEKGGSVQITGDQVGLIGNAYVDATGAIGGGTVLIGGDYMGGGGVQTAAQSYFAYGAVVDVSAAQSGDGGKAILWADGNTQFYGSIYAKGADAGKGGFVETSGANTLTALGTVRTQGGENGGDAGTWLLDPNDILIRDDAGGAPDDTNTIDANGPNFDSNNDSSVVTTEAIEAVLNAGGDVTVTTKTNGTNAQSGNITVVDDIIQTSSLGGNNRLTLNAHGNIIVDGATLTRTGSDKFYLTFNADSDANGSGGISLINSAVISQPATSLIFYASSGFSIDSTSSLVAGAISLRNSFINQTIAIGAGMADLVVSNDTLGRMSANNYGFGTASSGDITINTTKDWLNAILSLSSGSDIIIAGNIVRTATSDTTYVFEADRSIYNINNAGIFKTSGTAKTNITFHSDYDGTDGGAIRLTGGAFTSQGGNIILGGGSDLATGYAQGTSAYASGIRLHSDATLNAGTGNITLRGRGYDGTGNYNPGVYVSTGSKVKGGGTINITGIGGGTGASIGNYGILIDGVSGTDGTNAAIESSGTGAMTITGTGGNATGSGGNNFGISQSNTGRIAALGSGTITINATGGGASGTTGNATNYGYSSAGTISGNGGLITITATGGGGTSNVEGSHYGMFNSGDILNANGGIAITATGGGTGGSTNTGFRMSAGTINGGSGTITINGIGGAGTSGAGFSLSGGAIGVSGTSGGINLFTNTLGWSGLTVTTSGALAIGTRTAGATMSVGPASGSDLNLSTAMLDLTSAGSYVLGVNNSGMLTINTAKNFGDKNLTFISGGDITLAGNLTRTSGTAETTYLFKANGYISTGNFSVSANSGMGKTHQIYWSDVDQATSAGGQVVMGAGTFNTRGGDFIIGGGADDGANGGTASDNRPDNYAHTTSGNSVNIGATINTHGGHARIYGSTSGNAGLLFGGALDAGTGNIVINGSGVTRGFLGTNGSIKTAGNGTISITGSANGTGTQSYGLAVTTSTGLLIQSENGDITLTGNTTGASSSNQGIMLERTASTNTTISTTGTGSVYLTGKNDTGGNDLYLSANTITSNNDINITANVISNYANSSYTAADTIFYKTRATGGNFTVGSSGPINSTFLSTATAANWVFGAADAGTITIATTKDFGNANVSFISGTDINLWTTLTKATGTGTANYLFQAKRNIYNTNNAGITTSAGKANITFNADYDQATVAGGYIRFNSSTYFTSGGGHVVMGGGLDPTAGYAYAGTGAAGVGLTSGNIDAAGGNITLNGRGAENASCANSCWGVAMNGSTIQTNGAGNITVKGLGGSQSTNNQENAVVFNQTTMTAGTGTIDVTGTKQGSSSAGISFASSTVSSTGGDIYMRATAGNAGAFQAVTLSAGRDLHLIADYLAFSTYLTTSAGRDLYIRSGIAGTAHSVGSTVSSTFNVSNAILGAATAGGAIILGNLDGDMTVNTTTDFGNNSLTLLGKDISLAGTLTKATGTGTASYVFLASGSISNSSSAGITRSSGALNIVLNADRDANQNGAISLNNGTFSTNGGYLVMGGGSGTLGGTNGILGDGDGTGADDVAAWGNATALTGVSISGATITTGGGHVFLTGHGGNNSGVSANRGVTFSGNASLTTTSGNITFKGTGGNGDDTNYGVNINGASTLITTGTGAIRMTGVAGTDAGADSDYNMGVRIDGGATVSSTGTGADGGTITITGTGANADDDNDGVILLNTGTKVTSVRGAVNITGTGGSNGTGGSTNNHGFYMYDGASVESTGAASITITGIRPTSGGYDFVTAGTGANTIGGASAAGNITLNIDNSVVDANTVIRTTGTIGLLHRTLAMTVGNTGVGNFTYSMLNGGHYAFGAGAGADLTINTNYDFGAKNLTFVAGQDINLAATLRKSTGAGTADYTFQAGRDIYNSSSAGIVADSGAINLTLNADRDSTGGGAISFAGTGSGITTNGGHIVMGGGSDPASGYAQTSAARATGINLDQVTINTNGGAFTARGANTGAAIGNGILMVNGASITTGAGNVALYGKHSGSGTISRGLILHGSVAATSINTTTGNISLYGEDNAATADSIALLLYQDVHLNVNGSGIITLDAGGTNTTGYGTLSLYGATGKTVTIGGATTAGNININADTFAFTAPASVQTQNILTVRNRTAGRAITVGSTGGLGISNTALSNMNAGSYVFGSATSGTLTINTTHDFANKDVTFLSGSDIALAGTFTRTGSGSSTFSALTNITTSAAITTANGSLMFRANNNNLGSGFITIGHNITTGGGGITMGGGSGTIAGAVLNADGTINTAATGFAVGNAGQVHGISFTNGFTTNAGTGNIIVNGRGYDTTTDSNHGVQTSAAITTGGTGTININGLAGGLSGNSAFNYGVYSYGNGNIYTSGSGNMILTGTGGGSGSGQFNHGVYTVSGGTIRTTGTGAINIVGQGGTTPLTTSNQNLGVLLTSLNAVSTGNVTVIGTGGTGTASGGSDNGINIQGPVQGHGGTMTFIGNAGQAGTGIYISGTVSNTGGAMVFTGTGTGTGSGSGRGVSLNGGSANIVNNGVTSADTITITGTGSASGSASTNNAGVQLSLGAQISTNGGNLNIAGTGGTGSGSGNHGIYVTGANSAIKSIGAGNIILNGTGTGSGSGSPNHGIYSSVANGINATGSGSITLTGTTGVGAASTGIATDVADGVKTASGNITLLSDSFALSIASSVNSAGILTITPKTTGSMALGTTGSTLNFSTAFLNYVTGASYVFGSNNTGDLTIATTADFGDKNVTFVSGQDIILSGTLTKGTGTGSANYIFQAKRDIYNSNSAGISATSGKINLTLQSDTDQATDLGGRIYLTNGSFLSNGGDIILSGGSNVATGYAYGRVGAVEGIRINGATVDSSAGNLTVRGHGYDSGSQAHGLYLYSQGKLRASGMLTINAVGGGSGSGVDNMGAVITGSNTRIRTDGSGLLSITALGGNASGSGGNNAGLTNDSINGIQATGTGAITINATGGGGSGSGGSNTGYAAAGSISANGGLITLNATAGAGSGINNYGIFFGNVTGAGVYNTTGNINITGTGAGSGAATGGRGVRLAGGTLDAGSGTLTLTGIRGTSDAEDLHFNGGAIGTGTTSGSINLIGDVVNITNWAAQTSGALTFANRTAGTTIALGPTSGSTLNLSTAILNMMSAGSYVFGSTNSGDVTVNTSKDFGDKNVSFISGNDVILAGTLTKATGTGTADYRFQAARSITNSNSAGISATAGKINLTMAADYDGNNEGYIYLSGSTVSTAGGNITLGGGSGAITAGSGYAVGNATSIYGVNISNSLLEAGGGHIVINGKGAALATDGNYGIHTTGTIRTSGAGTITLNGIGGGTGASSSNIGINITGLIEGANGALTLTGTGGDAGGTGSSNQGIRIASATGIIKTTGSGNIAITGTGSNSSGDNNHGVNTVTSASIQTTGTGTITITGNAAGTGFGYGVFTSATSISGNGGDITLNGTSSSTSAGSSNRGTNITAASAITNAGAGKITLIGTTSGANTNYGVHVHGSSISTVNGLLSLTGTNNATGTGNDNYGIQIASSGAAVYTTGSGGIVLNGTAGNGTGGANHGVNIVIADAVYTSGAGSITLNGTAGGTSGYGFNTTVARALNTTGTGNISLYADSLNVTTTDAVKTLGILTLAPLTSGGTMGIGPSSGSTLNVTTTQLGYLNGASYVFGSASSGDLTINTAKDFVDKNVTFVSGRDINLAGSLTKGTGSGTANYLFQAKRDIYNSNSAGISATNGKINLTLQADTDQATDLGGAIMLTGGSFLSNGGNIILSGGADVATGFAYGNSGRIAGIRVDGTVVDSGVGTLTARGHGYDSGSSAHGVILRNAGKIKASGALTISGIGGGANTGTDNYGVFITDANSQIQTSGSNLLSVSATGGNASGSGTSNYGMRISSVNGIQATGSGAITINATGGVANGTGGSGFGMIISGGSIVANGGDITLNSTGGGANNTTSGGHYGIYVSGNITNNNGNIIVNATGGGNSATTSNHGFRMDGGTIDGGSGTITINAAAGVVGDDIAYTGGAIGSGTTSGAINILMNSVQWNTGTITTSGILTLANRTAGTSIRLGQSSGSNLNISTAMLNLTTAGSYVFGSATSGLLTINTAKDFADKNITFISGTDIDIAGNLTKTSGAGAANYLLQAKRDVYNSNNAGISATSGKINLTFQSDNDQATVLGGAIRLTGGSFLSNGGNILLSGGANVATGYAYGHSGSIQGIKIDGTTVDAGAGMLTARGHGYDSSNAGYMHGIYITNAGKLKASGAITVTGIGGGTGTGADNFGIYIDSANSTIQSDGAALLSVSGTGGNNGGSGVRQYGISIDSLNGIRAAGGGAMLLNGTGGNAGGNSTTNHGIAIGGSVTGTGGTITLNGNGGGYSGGTNYGVFILAASGGVLNANGNIVINAAGGADSGGGNRGFRMAGGAVDGGSGTITINGIRGGGSNSDGYYIDGGAIGTGTTSGAINLLTDSVSWNTGTVTTSGTLTVGTYTAGTTMSVGPSSGSSLNLSTAILNLMSAGNYVFGNDASGLLTVNTAKNFADKNLTFISGTDIVLAGNLSKTGGTGTAAYLFQAKRDIYNSNNAGIAATSGKIDLTLQSDTDQASDLGGAIAFTNGSLNSNGGNIVLSGGANVATGYAYGHSGRTQGIKLDSTDINTGGGTLTMRGHGYDAGGDAYGIYLTDSAHVQSAGAMTLTGTGGGGATGANNHGIYVDNGAILETTGSGLMSLTGTGGNATGSGGTNYGISLTSSSQIKASGAGAMTLMGQGGNNAGGSGASNHGGSFAGTISGNGGLITLTTTAGQSTGDSNYGISLGGSILNANGDITITATGGGAGASSSNHGFRSAGTVNGGSGTLTITGQAGNGGTDIRITGGSIGTGTTTGTIALRANTFDISAGAIQTAGQLSLAGRTAGRGVQLGSTAGGMLSLSNAMLDLMSAGTYSFGATDAGDITVGTTKNFGNGHLNIVSGGNITLSGTLTKSSGTGTANYIFQAKNNILNTNNAGINATAGKVNLTMTSDTDYASAAGGTLTLTGASLLTGGGAIALNSNGQTLSLAGTTTIGGDATLTSGGSAVNIATLETDVDGTRSLSVDAGTNTLTTTGTIGNTNKLKDMSVTADDVVFAGNIKGTGALTIQAKTASRSMRLGYASAPGYLHMSNPEIGYLQNWADIYLGRTNGTGLFETTSVDFKAPVTFRGDAGVSALNIAGAVTTTGGKFDAGGLYYTWFAPGIATTLTTNGGNIILPVTYFETHASAPVSINSGNGSITFTGRVSSNGVRNASIDAGTGALAFNSDIRGAMNLTLNAGSASFANTIGLVNRLGNLSLTTAGSISLPSINAANIFVQTTGASANITIPSASVLNTNGAGDAIKLVAKNNFINQAATPFTQTGGGRFLVYSTNTTGTQLNGLSSSFVRYSCTYGGTCPSFASETGSGLLYSFTPMLTVTPNAVAAISYGSAAPNLTGYTYGLTGWLSGADQSANIVTGTLNGSTNYSQGANVGSYAINYSAGTLADTLGYGFTYANNTSGITVNARVLTISLAGTVSKTYDGTDAATLTSGNYNLGNIYNNETLAISNTAGTYDDKNAGSGKQITVNGLTLTGTAASNYTLASTTVSGNVGIVNKRDITVSGIGIAGKTYDGSASAAITGVAALSNTISGDSISLGGTGSAVFANANAGVSKAVTVSGYTVSGGDVNNYNFVQPAGLTATIAKKDVTATAAGQSVVYGSNAPTTTISYNGFITGEDHTFLDTAPTLASARSGIVNAGSYAGNYTLSGGADGNYNLTYVAGTLTVTKKTLNVTADNHSVVYGTNVPTGSLAYNGFITGESASVLDTAPTVASAQSGIVNAGSYAGNYTVSGGADNNYDFNYIAGGLTIIKKTLNVTADNKTVTYGTAVPTGSLVYNGFITGEGASVLDTAPTLVSAQSGIVNAGTYAGNYTVSGGADNNYDFNYVAGNLTISPAALHITADNKTITYGDAIPTGSYVISGYVNGDDVNDLTSLPTVSSLRSGLTNAGTYAGNYTVSGGSASNYTFNYVTGTLTVGKKTLAVQAGNATIEYGQSTPSASISYTGFITGESASVLDTAPHMTSAQNGIANAGTYNGNFMAAGGADNNYAFTYVGGNLVVTKKVLTVTNGSQTVTYGTVVPHSNLVYSGFVAGDNAGVLDVAPTATSAHSGILNAGAYTGNYGVSGGSDNNYSFAYVGGNLVVNKKDLTAAATSHAVLAGSPVPAGSIVYSGFVNGENESVLDTAPVLTSARSGLVEAGNYYGNYTVGGGADGNYNLIYIAGDFIVTGEMPVTQLPSTVETRPQPQQTAIAETVYYAPIAPASTIAGGGIGNFISVDPDFAEMLNLDCGRAGIACGAPVINLDRTLHEDEFSSNERNREETLTLN